MFRPIVLAVRGEKRSSLHFAWLPINCGSERVWLGRYREIWECHKGIFGNVWWELISRERV